MDDDEKPRHKSLLERVFLDNFAFFNTYNDAEEILSKDLEHPNWHLKYARNIIYLILFFTISISVTTFIFPWYYSISDDISASTRGTILGVTLFIATICGIFDEILDQESNEVWWFNYARFWFVVLAVGIFAIMIGLFALKTITNFSI
ncbi:MAG: hypothetical protein K9M11_00155 [Candidatus Pacebacteria bacterium]|nr:hypothetical protein [Candidatus Paceibacterota bacterium]